MEYEIGSYTHAHNLLQQRLGEPAPGLVQILIGPRQVGKTTLLLELARENRDISIYVAADAMEAALPGWWDNLWHRLSDLWTAKSKAILLLDEIQYLEDWSRLLKTKFDAIKRHRWPVHIVATGSSSLQIGRGSRETMAGRFEVLQLTHWPPAEIAKRFGLEPREAVQRFVTCGGYPGMMSLCREPERCRDYVRQSILEPAIGRDLMFFEPIRKPALLRQVFAICAGHPAEIISLQKLCGNLTEKGALGTVSHYLDLLERAYLIAGITKFSTKALRRRAAPPKIVPLDQAILWAMDLVEPPGPEAEPSRWGRWVENACIAYAFNRGQNVCYWRAEPYEVDMVTTGTWGKYAIEVKTGPFTTHDLKGVGEFCRMYSQFRPLILCNPAHLDVARNAGFSAIPWERFLLGELP